MRTRWTTVSIRPVLTLAADGRGGRWLSVAVVLGRGAAWPGDSTLRGLTAIGWFQGAVIVENFLSSRDRPDLAFRG